ncbi:MAG TPA: DUF2812 domain-containing protein [Anaerolineales bacterium]|nr:DUF2812 domain-containing protein [Anaerolineales bacterium]
MDKTTLRKFKWFWAWQDEAEENWLRKMANEGWHLSGIGFPTIYDFKLGEPKDTVYRLDYRSYWKMDKEDYLQLFRDSGWECVDEMAGWHYFRQLARPGEELEIYTDAESKIGKYQRLLAFLGILMLPLVFAVINLSKAPYGFVPIIQVFNALIFVLYVYAIIRILLRIRQLKRI